MHRENAKIISMRVKTQNSSRTFRRRSRSWWIRSRRGHFFKVVRDETGVEIRVFVWWFLYIRVCILKFYATKTEEGVKRKRRERRRGGFLEKIFFGGGWHFWLLVKKSFLSFGSPLLRRRATRQPRTRVQEAPDKLFSLLCRKEKEGKRSAHKNTALSRRN